jgi:hypothetical protein
VVSAESPLTCVAVGSGQALDHFDQLVASTRKTRGTATYSSDWRTV